MDGKISIKAWIALTISIMQIPLAPNQKLRRVNTFGKRAFLLPIDKQLEKFTQAKRQLPLVQEFAANIVREGG